jgi:hypothetical protein
LGLAIHLERGESPLSNNQSYFKVYQSLFINPSYVANLTDLEKVMLMLIQSEMNRKETVGNTTGKAKIMRFSHYWLSAALSSHRRNISQALKHLHTYRLFDYTSGYNVDGGRTAPSTIRNLATEEFFSTIDRYTFENLLYEKLKNKEIKYRHIVVYALCKYIEQFHGGSVSVNEFGHMLGMTSGEIKYTRIKKPLEDLKAMKLINFEKAHGKITGVEVHSLPLSNTKQFQLREIVKAEAEDKRFAELGIKNKEVAAAVEDLPVSENVDDVISTVKDIFAKRTGKKAILTADQKKRILGATLSIREMHQSVQPFFTERYDVIRKTDGHSIFGHFANYLSMIQIQKTQGQM